MVREKEEALPEKNKTSSPQQLNLKGREEGVFSKALVSFKVSLRNCIMPRG